MLSTLLQDKAHILKCRLELYASTTGLICGLAGFVLFCLVSPRMVADVLIHGLDSVMVKPLIVTPILIFFLIWQWKKRNVLYKNLRLRSELAKRNTAF